MKKNEKDEVLDEVLRLGQEQLRQSHSSSALQDVLNANDLSNDAVRIGRRGVILNEYGQSSASHHFYLNQMMYV